MPCTKTFPAGHTLLNGSLNRYIPQHIRPAHPRMSRCPFLFALCALSFESWNQVTTYWVIKILRTLDDFTIIMDPQLRGHCSNPISRCRSERGMHNFKAASSTIEIKNTSFSYTSTALRILAPTFMTTQCFIWFYTYDHLYYREEHYPFVSRFSIYLLIFSCILSPPSPLCVFIDFLLLAVRQCFVSSPSPSPQVGRRFDGKLA